MLLFLVSDPARPARIDFQAWRNPINRAGA